MKIKALEIIEKEAYLIKAFQLSDYHDFYFNKNLIDNHAKKQEIILKKTDSLEILPRQKEIIGYKKDNSFLSIEEYKSKPTYFDSDSSEEETLRAIANRKEIEGFEPVYKEIDFETVEIDVYGFIEDTKSKFIQCGITDRFNSKNPNVYILNENKIAVDEYNLLKDKYSSHGKFDKLDRNYIEFAKINGNYAFSRSDFSEKRADKLFASLETATQYEKELREKIQKIVKSRLFPEKIQDDKRLLIISHLKSIKKAKSKSVMDEMLQILIEDLQDYKKEVELRKSQIHEN